MRIAGRVGTLALLLAAPLAAAADGTAVNITPPEDKIVVQVSEAELTLASGESAGPDDLSLAA